MTDEKTNLIRALSHPVRREALKLTYERQGEPTGTRQVATQLDQPLPNVNYHMRVLADSDLITLACTEEVRGSLANFYVCSGVVADNLWVRQALGIGDEDAG